MLTLYLWCAISFFFIWSTIIASPHGPRHKNHSGASVLEGEPNLLTFKCLYPGRPHVTNSRSHLSFEITTKPEQNEEKIPMLFSFLHHVYVVLNDLLVSDHTQSGGWSWKNTSWATVPPTILLTDKAWHCKILKQRRINVCLAWFGSVTLHWGDWDFTKKEWLTHLTVSDEVPSWAIALRQQRRERVNVFDWLNILTNKRATKMFDWANCKNNTIGWRCLIGWTVTANATDDRGVGGDWGMAWVHQVPVTSWSSGSSVLHHLFYTIDHLAIHCRL